MPSIDPKDLITLSPYLELCMRLGAFARQAASGTVQSLHITYLGEMIEFDTIYLLPGQFKKDGSRELPEMRG